MEYTDVIAMIEGYENEIEAIKKELFKLIWYMRGSVSLSEIYNSSFKDRKIIMDIISENLKTTKESGMPFF
tara:strand:- start:348 stop:560 length:213 start_codon:yes stop_codon:yes gene_type:complete